MIVFKGFNSDLACTRGSGRFQYKIGETATAEEAQTAKCGLHSTKEPFEVLRYYSNLEKDRFCICEAAGDINEDGDHRVSSTKLTPIKEITPQELAIYEAVWIEKHPSLPYSPEVCKEEGTDNGYFTVVRGKDPRGKAVTVGTVIILLQEYKTRKDIKAAAVYQIETVKDKGWYQIGGKCEKGYSAKIKDAPGDSRDRKKSKRGSAV